MRQAQASLPFETGGGREVVIVVTRNTRLALVPEISPSPSLLSFFCSDLL